MSRIIALAFLLALSVPALAKDGAHLTENVFLIISDGLRWQEVFNGAEEQLLNKTNGGVKSVSELRAQFWRNTPEERRTALFPFLWNEVSQHGQLYGNQAKGSVAHVTNPYKFSYPGYNEMLTGVGDPRINSNDKIPNPNVNVFEWVQQQPGFRQRVVAFGSWDVFPYIFNQQRSHIPVWPPWELKFADSSIAPRPELIELMTETTPVFEGMTFDSFLFQALREYLSRQQPRLVFVGFGETDEWAHAGRYDLYLDSAHNVDHFIQVLWNTVQQLPQYREKTTFIISADHGRGSGLTGWKDHGEKVDGAEGIFLAVIGPDTPALGERVQAPKVTQSQIAATIAAWLGCDYRKAFPQAGTPIAELLGSPGDRRPSASLP